MTDTPPSPRIEPLRQKRRRAISPVWLVPVLAVMVALAIAWESYANRGVRIAVAFPDASGVTAGETTLRFRDVAVGLVEDVGFSTDLSAVNVYVRVNRDIAPFLDEDATFWVVQPEVTARGVEGLNTILSGTYIEGAWDNRIGTSPDRVSGHRQAAHRAAGSRGHRDRAARRRWGAAGGRGPDPLSRDRSRARCDPAPVPRRLRGAHRRLRRGPL